MAGRLGGKRFLPQWIQDDTKTFQDLVGLTLDTIGPDPSVAGDEAIQFMIKCSSQSPEKWLAVIENNPDTIVELSRAFTAQWFKSPEWEEKRQKLITATKYVADDWHNMEKDIQEYRAARQAKKVRQSQMQIYCTILYMTMVLGNYLLLSVSKEM